MLLPHDRIARAPLGKWAGQLIASLGIALKEARNSRPLARQIAGIANNAALVATHHGETARAWILCERQCCWNDRLSRRSRDVAISANAIQPWVNLGRLEALSGDVRASLERFGHLNDYRETDRLRLGTITVGGTGWQAVAASKGEFQQNLDTVYVVDSLRALQMNHRFVEAIAFASALQAHIPESLTLRADEAVIVSRCRLEDFDGARQVAVSAAKRVRGWPRAVFGLRLAEVLVCAGDRGGAASVLGPSAAAVRMVSPETKHDLEVLYMISRLCTACGEVGLEDEMLALARDVYDGASKADDEVFQIESLRILAEHAPAPERGRWREELDRLEETTEYVRYRRGGKPATPNPVLERLYGELGEFLSN